MQHVFFLNFVRFPFVDYYDLQKHGVRGRGRNFYLHVGDYLGINKADGNNDANKENKSLFIFYEIL
uniref:Uncharacterized protein n=1 Tax=Meloidogyne incognita TaxID=6306 RepID=A0A914KNW1_MELIC